MTANETSGTTNKPPRRAREEGDEEEGNLLCLRPTVDRHTHTDLQGVAAQMIQHSESLAKIGPALIKIAAEIENPTKKSQNPHFKSKYADLAEIINVSRQICASHGVVVMQSPGMAHDLCTVDTLLVHESGEWVRGQAASPLQKNDPQGVGSAVTYLRRYSLAAMLGLAQEDDDGNAATRKAPPKAPEPAPAPDVKALVKRIETAALKEAITPAEAAHAIESLDTADDGMRITISEWLDKKAAALKATKAA